MFCFFFIIFVQFWVRKFFGIYFAKRSQNQNKQWCSHGLIPPQLAIVYFHVGITCPRFLSRKMNAKGYILVNLNFSNSQITLKKTANNNNKKNKRKMDKWSWKKGTSARVACIFPSKKKEDTEKRHLRGSWVNCTNFFPLVSFSRRDSLKAFISLSFTL